ncbi:unnamed protein product [Staurois parvus]|uniref:Secreted protein n=1 Tax=Staurois parvus TaxID=386267 RepID=A0ABN9ANL2_9NEOB|nr:unnamed protein product [Staurois parvus]
MTLICSIVPVLVPLYLLDELASTSGLVHPGLSHTSTAVSLGDVASPISAVQAGAVASTSIIPQPPRICTEAHRAPSIFPDVPTNL